MSWTQLSFSQIEVTSNLVTTYVGLIVSTRSEDVLHGGVNLNGVGSSIRHLNERYLWSMPTSPILSSSRMDNKDPFIGRNNVESNTIGT